MNIENRKFIVFAGYWQQLNIYKENELNEFKRFLFGNIKSNISKDIGIHIRGGDFLWLNKSLGMSFYDNALNQFKSFEPVTIFTNDKKTPTPTPTSTPIQSPSINIIAPFGSLSKRAVPVID